MSVHHLRVITPVLTLLVVLCAHVMMGMSWIVMEELVMVRCMHTLIATIVTYTIYFL